MKKTFTFEFVCRLTVLIDTVWPVNDGNSFKSSVGGGGPPIEPPIPPPIWPLPIFPKALCINKFVAVDDDDIDPDEINDDCPPVNVVDDWRNIDDAAVVEDDDDDWELVANDDDDDNDEFIADIDVADDGDVEAVTVDE